MHVPRTGIVTIPVTEYVIRRDPAAAPSSIEKKNTSPCMLLLMGSATKELGLSMNACDWEFSIVAD